MIGCLALTFFLAGSVHDLHAFSLGPIDIKSKFGDRFEAEIELIAVKDDKVSASIGDERDYLMLGLERKGFMEDLEVADSILVRGARRFLRIVSTKPLFYPSFDLLVRASSHGGTLLENYVVTVDFQQSLALNVKDPKKKRSEDKTVEIASLLEGGEAGLQ